MQPTDQLLAEHEIRRRLLEYCRGVDRCDAELIGSAYHSDATDDHGVFQGSGHELASFTAAALLEHYDATMHFLGDSLFEFTDDHTAYVETYVFADHRGSNENGQFLHRFAARYLDRFEQRDDAWRIADRVVVVEWSDDAPITAPRGAGRYVRGLRSHEDLAYQRVPRDPDAPLARVGDKPRE